MSVRLAPSILSADPTRLGDAVRMVERRGADILHVDIMDGHYVPNLTFGPGLVEALKRTTSLPVDVHLMVDDPERFIPPFLGAGADWLSFHAEASVHLHRDLHLIKSAGRKAGVALNPATPAEVLGEIVSDLDFILVMCVNPGWGSQPFVPSCREKIRRLKSWLAGLRLDVPISVDGGVKEDNIGSLVSDGAEILVVGSAIFSQADPGEALVRLKRAAAGGPVA